MKRVLCWIGLHRWRRVRKFIPAWDGVIRACAICLAEPAWVETGERKCTRCGKRQEASVSLLQGWERDAGVRALEGLMKKMHGG